LLNSDTVTSVTLTSAGATATAAVGPYPIVPSVAVGTGVGNYSITYVNGTLTVGPAGLTITANNASKIYGQTFSGTAFTPSGLLNGDTVTSVTLTSTGAPATAAVGSYPIVPSAAVGSGLANYTIAYVNGTLTVAQASTITTITSNLPNPAIVGQIVTVNFGVAPQFTGTPTGSVKVTASTGETCTGVLSAGTGSCPLTFLIGGSRTLTAVYSGDGNFFASPASAPVTQNVSGVSLSTTALLFGDQLVGTNSASQTATLSNVGTTNITGIAIVNSNTVDFTFTTTCGATLRVGRSCNIVVRFRPSVTGVRVGLITITDSDPTLQQVSLTGTGVVPINSVSPPAMPFNTQARGTTSAPQTATIANTGTANLTVNGVALGGANGGQFVLSANTCAPFPATLVPGAQCTVNVSFRPTSVGAKNALLNVRVAGPATNASVTLTGTGQ